MNIEISEAIDKYYKLKKKYDETIDNQKSILIKNETLTNSEKRDRFKKLVFKCVNCNKKGGTVFSNKNGVLKAECGASTPCTLNIEINKGIYQSLREATDSVSNNIEKLKTEIIDIKLKFLFNFIDETQSLEQFDEVSNYLSALSSEQLAIQKKYNEVVDNKNKEFQLDSYMNQLGIELEKIKKLNKLYMAEKRETILKTIIENYTAIIKPLVDEIRNLKFAYVKVESITPLKPDGKLDENNKINSMITEPYTIDQAETEIYSDKKPGIIHFIK